MWFYVHLYLSLSCAKRQYLNGHLEVEDLRVSRLDVPRDGHLHEVGLLVRRPLNVNSISDYEMAKRKLFSPNFAWFQLQFQTLLGEVPLEGLPELPVDEGLLAVVVLVLVGEDHVDLPLPVPEVHGVGRRLHLLLRSGCFSSADETSQMCPHLPF